MKTTWMLTGQLSQDERLRCIPLHTMPFRVGRRTDLSLCLSRPSMSSLHAEFVTQGSSLFLRDLHSTNGTYVNGDRVGDQIEVHHDDMIQFADMPFRLGQQSSDLDSRTMVEDVCDRALGLVQFEKLVTERAVVAYFQAVVELRDNHTVAYEVLSRSRLVGLETPATMFRAAAQLNAEVELSRAMRIEGVRSSAMFSEPPHIFVNTHPRELVEEGLLDSMKSLRRLAASQPITVEIHEAAVTDVSTMKELRSGLDDLNMCLAFDDFGAGQARLFELAEVRPHYLKFDRQMVQDIHRASSQRQQVLAHLVRLVSELGVLPVAEGIECEEEGTVCREMDFVLAQGFYYGKPAPVSAYTSPARSLL
ncbi:MAG: EAL domain-containing protein [Planctomycetia bacterium]|nr:EAL domain-containing protein [Planctomycetia bacterium]